MELTAAVIKAYSSSQLCFTNVALLFKVVQFLVSAIGTKKHLLCRPPVMGTEIWIVLVWGVGKTPLQTVAVVVPITSKA